MSSTSGQEEFLAVIRESRTVTAVVRTLAETTRIDRARRRA